MTIRFHIFRVLVLVSSVLFAGPAFAQKGPPPNPEKSDDLGDEDPAANEDWGKLVQRTPRANSKTDRAKSAGDAIAQADAARDFYSRHPKHKRAGAAKEMEIFALLEADDAQSSDVGARIRTTVNSIRKDPSVPRADRAAIAHVFDSRRAVAGTKTREELTQNSEALAKALINEFPDQPDGYTWLLNVASSAPDAAGPRIAHELASNSNAPADLRTQAERLYTRRLLVGKKLQDVVPQLSNAVAGASGKLIVVYAWSIHSQPSIALATLIGEHPKDRAVWIGINVDPAVDRTAAERVAQEHRFSGMQVWDSAGLSSKIAADLGIATPDYGLFVATDGTVGQCMDGNALLNSLPYFNL